MSQLTLDQRALYDLMSNISERCYAAGWLTGNEYRLWSAIADPTDQGEYGMSAITQAEKDALRRLSSHTGGWIIWLDDEVIPGLPVEQWGERFVGIAEWLGMYAASWRTTHAREG